MIASLFTGVVGFVFAFIANAKNTEVAGIINFNPDVSICGYLHELSISLIPSFSNLGSEYCSFCLWLDYHCTTSCECKFTSFFVLLVLIIDSTNTDIIHSQSLPSFVVPLLEKGEHWIILLIKH